MAFNLQQIEEEHVMIFSVTLLIFIKIIFFCGVSLVLVGIPAFYAVEYGFIRGSAVHFFGFVGMAFLLGLLAFFCIFPWLMDL